MRFWYLIFYLVFLCGCQNEKVNEAGAEVFDSQVLEIENKIVKNQKNFENNDQGKRELLLLMANSVDYYSYLDGAMVLTTSYQGEARQIKYDFQIDVGNYHSYIYQIASNSINEQCYFRDNEKMYFLNGNVNELHNSDIDELVNEKKMTVELVDIDNSLNKYADLSLEERIENLNTTRVANDLYGDVAPYVFPEDIALYQLGLNYRNYQIKENALYLNREVFVIEGIIDDSIYNEGDIYMLVDKQTGILLKYKYTSDVSEVEMVMNRLEVDTSNNEDMYLKWIKKSEN
ncbi:MAG: hypothetical protein ACLRT4_09845 [Thomasclavelia sp.]